MSSQAVTTTHSVNYDVALGIPYTGTPDQPDIVSIFFKNAQNEISIQDETIINSLDYTPLFFHAAIWRTQEAARKILSNMKGESIDLTNAFKNLARGVLGLIPLIGNGALYLYDSVKTRFYTHPQIKAALIEQSGPVLGIAFDGKIVSTFSLEKFEALLGGKLDGPFSVLSYIWASMLSKTYEKKALETPDITRAQLVDRLTKRMNG